MQIRGGLLIFISLLITQIASAMEAPVSMQTLAAKSDRIVRGKVVNVSYSQEVNDYGDELIFTNVTIRVSESLKGDRSDLNLKVEGGTIGNIRLDVSDTPEFHTGEEVLVLAKRRLTDYRPFGGLQSKYTILTGGKLQENGLQYSLLRTEILRAVHEGGIHQ